MNIAGFDGRAGLRVVERLSSAARGDDAFRGRNLEDPHLRRFEQRRDLQSVLLDRLRQPGPRITDGVFLEDVDDQDAIGQRAVGVGREQIGWDETPPGRQCRRR